MIFELKKRINDASESKGYSIFIAVLALVSSGIALIDLTSSLSPTLLFVDRIIYVIFVVEYFTRLWAANKKMAYIKHNVIDLVAILPFSSILRTLRAVKAVKIAKIAKVSKLFRVGSVTGRMISKCRKFFDTNGFKYVCGLCLAVVLIASIAMVYIEKMNFGDALWWSFVTATTVGYGDLSPATPGGRIVASILMLTGIGLIGSLTSSITGYFMNKEDENDGLSNDKIMMVKTLYETLNEQERDEFLKSIDK